MADLTLKDVLNAIAKLDAKIAKLDAKVDVHRTEATADLAELRTEMTKRFDALDDELTTHAKVHKEIEKDITGLKGRPPRTAARAARRR